MASFHTYTTARRGGQQPNRPHNPGCQNPDRGLGKQKQRIALQRRCFWCARDDHMLPQCTFPDTVKCDTCAATDHISAAYGRSQNIRSVQHNTPSSSSTSSSVQQRQQLHTTTAHLLSSLLAELVLLWSTPPLHHVLALSTLFLSGLLQKCICDWAQLAIL